MVQASEHASGKPVFSMTSHLVLVWKYLSEHNSSTIGQTSIVFKNVSLIKDNAPTSKDKLQVTILPASGDFEVHQDGEIIITGNAKILKNVNEAKVSLPYISIKEHILNSEDIYEDLTKRGYSTDSFKCIKSSNANTEGGYLTWKDWPSFLDAMFQFNILGRNTQSYFSPQHIETIVIDTKYHETVCLQYEDLPVYNHKTINVTVAGGVQISGIKWNKLNSSLEVKFEMQARIDGKFQTVGETQKELEHVHLELCQPGDLTSFRWVEILPILPTPQTEVCHVYFASLNHQDWVLASGKPVLELQLGEKDHLEHLGIEFSGRTSSGKRVMGIVQRGLASTVLADKRFLWDVPPNWTLTMAASVPVAFSTAYYALVVRGKIKAKQTVVVYHGCSDIGLAAIALATHMGCKVYSTYGTRNQRQFISSKFLEVPDGNNKQHWDPTFEKLILDRTSGRGADVILNQLGTEKMSAALSCLADGGRLLHIGDDLRSTDLSSLSPNKTLHCINMSSLGEGERLEVAALLSEGIRQGHVYPMWTTCFSTDVAHVREAFETLNRRDGIGKVIIRVLQEEEAGQHFIRKKILASLRPHIDSQKTYILNGGPDVLTLQLGNWLISRGATKLVISRADEFAPGYLVWGIERWRQRGINVLMSRKDAYVQEEAKEILREASALGLVDGVFDMTASQKGDLIEGIKTLDKVTREFADKLNYFVIFSSLKQNHQMTESLVNIVQSRKRSTLPGIVVDLGPVGASQKADTYNVFECLSKNMRSAVNNLDSLLVQPHDVVSCLEVESTTK